ncbi:Glucose/arabinose dehydrogenase, beta-propeller fold [Amycolatopsis pretoriensis]|uniref:Glucose/arabinose dehydrogenase, beta-propeller fold n=1 Tax=Amycolatopsis pretoriensis TaxID=218821 RepID=A0A1H5REG3_9PSEU|nr:PQQ-dependent sugar dehydrogenase [Amycolatopsis pretoriensis]SEF36434.1 Glucose/arabinose dehydrogenase, beta-propeller fold [Amycolatopsis pretoriensis]
MGRRIRVGAMALALAAATISPAGAADSLLSQGKPVTASSSGGCCPAANAVDGDSATRWASAAGVDPQWIYVDLGAAAHVSRVRLQWDASCATAYEIDTSADHVTWTKIYATTTGKGGVEDLTSLDGTGRYVRVYGTKRCRTDASKGYSLQEFGVYGSTGDVTPPSPPGTPTLVSVTPASATIAWTAASDDAGVAGYDVYRDGQLCASTTGALQATCGNLSPNGTYGFYVNARDAAGNVSQASGTLSVKTPPSDDHTPPSVPGNVHTTSVSSTSIGLAWTASTDDVGVTGYRIYDSGTQLGTSDTAATTLGGLTPAKAYHLQVRAVDANGNLSDPSTPVLDVTTTGGSNCTPAQGVCGATQVATDDDVVWGLVSLPDGTILYNQRDAHDIVHLNPKTGAKKTIGTVPNVQSTDGEGGLTGLEVNPVSFASDHWLYLMHTSPNDNRIVRIKYDPAADSLTTSTEQVLLTGIARNKFHNGGRLRFSPDGRYLFAGTGDAQNGDNASNTSSPNGKVLRINPDGSIPADNPFHNAVWSYGHRNVQGLAFDSQGRLWEQEFGNSVMDETNLIVKGGNYGWPSCEGTSGSCTGFLAPKKTYPVAQGSCSGITIIHDALYVACQRGTRLYRAVIGGSSLTDFRTFFSGTYGRLRTVEPAPEGRMWLATSVDGDKDSTPHNSHNKILLVTVG